MDARLVADRVPLPSDANAVARVPLTTKTETEAQAVAADNPAATAAESSPTAVDGGATVSALRAKVQEQAHQLQKQSQELQQALQRSEELEDRLRQNPSSSSEAAARGSGGGELAKMTKAFEELNAAQCAPRPPCVTQSRSAAPTLASDEEPPHPTPQRGAPAQARRHEHAAQGGVGTAAGPARAKLGAGARAGGGASEGCAAERRAQNDGSALFGALVSRP